MDPVYLDHAATTPLAPGVLDAMLPYLADPAGNPSSVHARGRTARHAVEDARLRMARALGVEPSEIWFTSGGTEANNTAIVQAVGRGEVPFGLVNHYYNLRARAEDPGVVSENYYFPGGDIGSLLIVTAAGVLDSSGNPEGAADLLTFMLGEQAQTFYSMETLEYPLAAGVAAAGVLPDLATLNVATYDFDRLGGGLERTKELIDASGLEAP